MPNWTTNNVTIQGDAQALQTLKRKLAGKNGPFDFNGLIPMPKSLDIESGSRTRLGMACFDQQSFEYLKGMPWFPEQYPDVETPSQLRAAVESSEPKTVELGRAAVANVKAYGVPTWYEWCNLNWGTKWNACQVEIDVETDNLMSYKFDTAWSAPEPVAAELARMCGELGLDLEWVAEDEDAGGAYDVA